MTTFTHAHPLFNESHPRAYADLKPRQQAFVQMLYDGGARGNTVVRAGVKRVHEAATDFPWPSWLTGDKTRRCNRGVFYIPELAEYAANIVDDVDDTPEATTAVETPEMEIAHAGV